MRNFSLNALLIFQGFQTALGLLVGLLTYNNLLTFMTIKTTYIYTSCIKTYRQTDTHTDRQTNTETHRQTNTWIDRQIQTKQSKSVGTGKRAVTPC